MWAARVCEQVRHVLMPTTAACLTEAMAGTCLQQPQRQGQISEAAPASADAQHAPYTVLYALCRHGQSMNACAPRSSCACSCSICKRLACAHPTCSICAAFSNALPTICNCRGGSVSTTAREQSARQGPVVCHGSVQPEAAAAQWCMCAVPKHHRSSRKHRPATRWGMNNYVSQKPVP